MNVALRVADEGDGIPVAERSRLFTRYARGASAAKDGVPGTGMGLALVRELAIGMGGTVTFVEREAKKGACFELWLPGNEKAMGET